MKFPLVVAVAAVAAGCSPPSLEDKELLQLGECHLVERLVFQDGLLAGDVFFRLVAKCSASNGNAEEVEILRSSASDAYSVSYRYGADERDRQIVVGACPPSVAAGHRQWEEKLERLRSLSGFRGEIRLLAPDGNDCIQQIQGLPDRITNPDRK